MRNYDLQKNERKDLALFEKVKKKKKMEGFLRKKK